MVAGAKGENEPEAWRRLPDTAWLQRNFADRHEAAWRAHTDRLRYTYTHTPNTFTHMLHFTRERLTILTQRLLTSR